MEKEIDSTWTNEDYEIKEQDRFLPIANVGRVMKSALPAHAKLSKGSKVCIQECVSEFISFITSQSVDRCKVEKRKTLNGEDILWAMYTLGFENYSETLKIYLAKYREYEQKQAEKRPPRRSRKKSGKKSTATEFESEELLSEDISPENTDDNSVGQTASERDYLKESVNLDPNTQFKYDFPDSTFSNFSLSQRNSMNNYLMMPSSVPSSGRSSGEKQSENEPEELPNFDEFVDRIQ